MLNVDMKKSNSMNADGEMEILSDDERSLSNLVEKKLILPNLKSHHPILNNLNASADQIKMDEEIKAEDKRDEFKPRM